MLVPIDLSDLLLLLSRTSILRASLPSAGAKVSVRSAQRRYAASDEVKKDQSERMREYRLALKSSVIDQGSTDEGVVVKWG